jgi:hypothetical protein
MIRRTPEHLIPAFTFLLVAARNIAKNRSERGNSSHWTALKTNIIAENTNVEYQYQKIQMSQ